MQIILRIVGAVLLAYFVSRLTLRLPNPLKRFPALMLAHLLAFAINALIIMALRSPLNVFAPRQTLILLFAQIAWLLIDQMRGNHPARSS